jgi:hypothetical protein
MIHAEVDRIDLERGRHAPAYARRGRAPGYRVSTSIQWLLGSAK